MSNIALSLHQIFFTGLTMITGDFVSFMIRVLVQVLGLPSSSKSGSPVSSSTMVKVTVYLPQSFFHLKLFFTVSPSQFPSSVNASFFNQSSIPSSSSHLNQPLSLHTI